MVTEGLRVWSELPFTTGVETTGTAGVTEDLPFAGDAFACCAGFALPATAGVGVDEPAATGAGETAFLVAEAYEMAGCDAPLVVEAELGFWFGGTEVIELSFVVFWWEE